MTKWIELKYCPRTKKESPSPLKKPIRRCKWRNIDYSINSEPDECHYWTMKGLIKYCNDNGIKDKDLIGTRCRCVIRGE